MPRVPTLDNFSVMPDAGGLPQVSAPEVNDVGSRQLSAAGQAISQGADVLSRIVVDRQQEANQLRVTDALNKAKEEAVRLTFDKDVGFTAQRGLQALERPNGQNLTDEYSTSLGQRLSEIQAGLGNSAQRAAFARAGMELMGSFRQDTIRHEAKEFETYAISVDEGAITNAQNSMGLYYNDPKRIDEAALTIRASTDRLRQRLGKSAEWGEARTREQLTKGHLVAIATAVEKNDIDYAEGYLDKYRDQIEADGVLRVEGLITKQKDAIVAEDVATEVYTGASQGEEGGPVVRPAAGDWEPAGGQRYGAPRSYGGHSGVDKAMPVGTAVSAPESGILRIRKTKGGGNEAWIESTSGRMHKLLHLSGYADGMQDGMPVRAGQVIAKSGNTGSASKGAHLHWTVLENGKPVNPLAPRERRGYAGKSLEDMLLELRARPEMQGRPERLREAEQRVTSLYQANRESQRVQREQTELTVLEKLYKNGGNFGSITAAERAALGADGMRSMFSFANSVEADRRSDRAEREQNYQNGPGAALWAQLKLDPARLKSMSAADLVRLRPQIGEANWKDLVTDRNALDKGDTAATSAIDVVRAALSDVKPELVASGLQVDNLKPDTDEARQYGAFQAQYVRVVQAEQQATGKKVTPDRAREIALDLASKQVIKKGFFGDTKQFRFEGGRPAYQSIPAGVRSALIQSLQKRNPNVRVTEAMVRDEYATFLYSR